MKPFAKLFAATLIFGALGFLLSLIPQKTANGVTPTPVDVTNTPLPVKGDVTATINRHSQRKGHQPAACGRDRDRLQQHELQSSVRQGRQQSGAESGHNQHLGPVQSHIHRAEFRRRARDRLHFRLLQHQWQPVSNHFARDHGRPLRIRSKLRFLALSR